MKALSKSRLGKSRAVKTRFNSRAAGCAFNRAFRASVWGLVLVACVLALSLVGGCQKEPGARSPSASRQLEAEPPLPDAARDFVSDSPSTFEELIGLVLEGDECQVVARDVPDAAISLGRIERERLGKILEQCFSQDLELSEGTEPSPPVQPYPDYSIILANNGARHQVLWQGRLVEVGTLRFLDAEDLTLYTYLESVLPAPDPLALGDPYTLFHYERVSIPGVADKPHVSLIAARVLRTGRKLDAIPVDAGDLWYEAVFNQPVVHSNEGVSSEPLECKVSVYEHGFVLNEQYFRLQDAGLRCARAVLDAPRVDLDR